MAGQIKFVLDVEDAKAVQAMLRLRDAEKQAEQNMQGLAASARSAVGAVEAYGAAARQVQEYDFASAAASARRTAIPLPRTADPQAFIRRRADVAALELTAPALDPQLARQVPRADQGYGLAGEFNFDRANWHASDPVQARMGAERVAAQIRAEAAAREQAESQIALNNFDLKIRKQQQFNAEVTQQSRAVDQVAGQVRAEAAARAEAIEAGEKEIALNNFGRRMDANRKSRQALSSGLMGGGMLLGGAVMAFEEGFTRVAGMLDQVGAAGVQFDNEMRPLLSLGDNENHAARLKEQVLALSGAFAVDRQSAASSLFMLQSTAGNLAPDTQKQILQSGLDLNNVAGGDLKTDLVAITKLMETYGSELGSADKAAAKLLATEDSSAITLDELAQLLPDVLPAAKLMGNTYDEVAASVITATQVMGTNEKTLTGLRNMFLKLGQAQAEGLIHGGRLIDQLRELGQIDPIELEKMFGLRGVTVVAALAAHTADVARNLQSMEKIVGSEVFQKFLERQQNASTRDAGLTKGVNEELKNVDVIRAQNDVLRDLDLRNKLMDLGYKSGVNPLIDALTPQYAVNLHKVMPGDTAAQEWLQEGLNIDIANKIQAGDPQSIFEANLEKIRFGDATGTVIKGAGPHGADRPTGPEDAQRFVELDKQMHGQLKFRDFLDLEQMEHDNPAGAAQFLASLQAVANQMQQAARQHAQAAAQQQAAANTQAAAAKTPRGGAARPKPAADDDDEGSIDPNVHTN